MRHGPFIVNVEMVAQYIISRGSINAQKYDVQEKNNICTKQNELITGYAKM